MRLPPLRRATTMALLLAALAACGGANEPGRTAGTVSSRSTASTPAASAFEPSARPSVAASLDAAASTAADGPYAGLAQSKTPEGYFVLGESSAPVTLLFYSDFI